MEEPSIQEHMAAVSRSLEQQASNSGQGVYESNLQHELSKKRSSNELDDSSKDGENLDEVKKMKKQSSGNAYQYATSDEMASLEALAQGNVGVHDMSNVASSIASLANPNQPQWPTYIMPVSGNTGTGQQSMYQPILLPQQWYFQHIRDLQGGRDDGQRVVSMGQTIPSHVFTSQEGNGFFQLLEQPNETQRKSYKNENRCILPNPLTICMKEFLPEDKRSQLPPIDGHCTVSLVDQEGDDLPSNKAAMLESIERSLSQPLDENHSAQFSLKVMETSEGNMLRLLFIVRYKLKGLGPCEERILSRPFIVYSNRKKHVKGSADKDRPIVMDLKPARGEYNKETEVWIKGRGFNDKVVVNFGDKQGKVQEATENLITVLAPPRDDIVQDSIVEVTVANKFAREYYAAEKKLNFTYTTGPNEVRMSSLVSPLHHHHQVGDNVLVPMMQHHHQDMDKGSVTAELQPPTQ